MAGRSSPPIAISSPTTRRRITRERPANIRTIERYLLLAGDLPGLKFKNSLKPHPSKPGAAILVVEVTEKPVDLFARVRQSRHQGARPDAVHDQPTANNLVAHARGLDADLCRRDPDPRAHLLRRDLPAGPDQRRPHRLRQCQLRVRVAPAPSSSSCWNTGPGAHIVETGLSYPVIRARERNFNVSGLWFWSEDRSSFFDMPNVPPSTLDKMRGFRLRAEADSADQSGAINQLYFVFSQGILGLGNTENGGELALARTAGPISPRWN